jgi:hypothetical protein
MKAGYGALILSFCAEGQGTKMFGLLDLNFQDDTSGQAPVTL